MAKLNAPICSFGAKASLAKRLTYQDAPSGSRAISFPSHPDAKTPSQLIHRSKYQDAVLFWWSLHIHEREFYGYLANQLGITGFNYAVAQHLLGQNPTW